MASLDTIRGKKEVCTLSLSLPFDPNTSLGFPLSPFGSMFNKLSSSAAKHAKQLLISKPDFQQGKKKFCGTVIVLPIG